MLSTGSGLRYIVPIPYSCGFETGTEGQPQPRLSIFSQVVVDACAQLWKEHTDRSFSNESPHILLAAETPLPKGYPTTAELMTRSLLTQDVPYHHIINLDHTGSSGKPLNWTTRQIGAIANFTQNTPDLSPETVRLIPLGYHLPRVAKHATAFGLQASTESAETILGRSGNIEHYRRALQLLESVIPSERGLRLLACFDGKGHLLEFLDNLSGDRGSRILDVADDRLIKETSSKRFFSQLKRAAQSAA